MRPGGPAYFVHHAHHGHPFLWLVLLIVLIALAGFALYVLIRTIRMPGANALVGPGSAVALGDNALELVRLRYAKGEIDRDEFVRVSTDLGAPPAPAT